MRAKSGVLIVAGEVSGDIHAGNMLLELNNIRPDVKAFGVGGDRLIAAGLDTVANIDELAHMGLVEVLQIFQPARYFQSSDLAATAIGSVLVCMAIGLWLAYKPKNLRPAP